MVNKTIATSYPWEGERGKGICSVTWEREKEDVNCCKGGEEKSQKLVQCGESGKKGMAVNLCCMKRVYCVRGEKRLSAACMN